MKVIGLGTLCLTSQLLKQMGLKDASMPFDWIFSSPEMISHAIRDDFKEFLARENIVMVEVGRRPDPALYRADHVFYRDRYGVNFVFNHHDPSENEDDYRYFVRCVDRFRDTLKGERVLFLLCRHLHKEADSRPVSTYRDLASLLNPHDLLCVEISTQIGSSPSYDVVESDGNLEVGKFRTSAALNGVSFGCREDHEMIAALVRSRAAGERPSPRRSSLPAAMPMAGASHGVEVNPKSVDQVTLYRGMLTVDGWSKAGPPMVTYKGELVSVWQCYPVERADVAQIYGVEARNWGFALRAIIGRPPIEQELLAITFPDGERIVAPQLVRVTASL